MLAYSVLLRAEIARFTRAGLRPARVATGHQACAWCSRLAPPERLLSQSLRRTPISPDKPEPDSSLLL